ECMPVDPSTQATGWPVKLTSEAATPLAVGDGRIALVDAGGVMHCWEQATGRRLWGVSLGSAPSGAPKIVRRKAYVGTADGRVMVFDVSDGRSLGVLRSPAGLTTAIEVAGNALFFGCADGAIRAVDFNAGKVLWTESIGRTPSSQGIALAKNTLLVAAEGRVIALDRKTGKRRGEMPTTDMVQGIYAQRGRAFLRLRKPTLRNQPVHDVLVACSSDTVDVLWEYALPTVGPGAMGVGASTVALSTASGQVVLFR
ncbi:MAG: outer membrane protein assembly factor BamB, partial [Planctomycetota bacterium]